MGDQQEGHAIDKRLDVAYPTGYIDDGMLQERGTFSESKSSTDIEI